jgi:hypothetical protein
LTSNKNRDKVKKLEGIQMNTLTERFRHDVCPECTTNPAGFYVDGQAWELAPQASYAENPPNDWEDCEQCGGAHPAGYTGDCRADINRWPAAKCIAALTETA